MTPEYHPRSATADDPIPRLHAALVDDLTTTLDLQAGAADATQAHHLTRLTADLDGLLDLNAGLAAIIGSYTVSSSPPTSGARPDYVSCWATEFVVLLRSLDAPARLRLRARADYADLRACIDLVTSIEGVQNSARSLAVRTVGVAANADVLANHLSGLLARIRALEATTNIDSNLADALRGALHRAIEQACLIATTRDLGARNLTHANELAVTTASARDLSHALAHHQARDLGRQLGAVRLTTRPASATALRRLQVMLKPTVDDFVGADLHAASLVDVPLQGIRWSTATRWPSGWQEWIRDASVEIAPGVFEITGRGREHRATDIGVAT